MRSRSVFIIRDEDGDMLGAVPGVSAHGPLRNAPQARTSPPSWYNTITNIIASHRYPIDDAVLLPACALDSSHRA